MFQACGPFCGSLVGDLGSPGACALFGFSGVSSVLLGELFRILWGLSGGLAEFLWTLWRRSFGSAAPSWVREGVCQSADSFLACVGPSWADSLHDWECFGASWVDFLHALGCVWRCPGRPGWPWYFPAPPVHLDILQHHLSISLLLHPLSCRMLPPPFCPPGPSLFFHVPCI